MMLKLKTITEFIHPTKRGVKTGIIRVIIDGFSSLDNNNLIPTGYYYYYDENNNVVKIDNVKHTQLWDDVFSVEENLPLLVSNKNLKLNLLQRLEEFFFIQMDAEHNLNPENNFGTGAADWVKDND